jgi:hypothetical protein
MSDDDLLPVAFDIEENFKLPNNYVYDEMHEESILFLKRVKEEGNIFKTNKSVKQIEYSIGVDNQNIFKDNYKQMGITDKWIKQILNEYDRLKNSLDALRNHNKILLTSNIIASQYKLYKENKYIQLPDKECINYLSTNMTNKLGISLLKILSSIYEANSDYNTSLWIYYLLHMLNTPLIDEDNSILYKLNKVLIKKNTNESKILHVIISEIFKQRLINS